MHARWSVGQTKSQMRKCLFCAEKVVKHLTFTQCPTCRPGECVCVIIHTQACLVFFTILPHLCLLSDIVLMSSSSLCFPFMSCIPFVSLCASGIILLFGLSFVMIFIVGGGGCLWVWSRMASSGSVFVCFFTWLHRKFSAVIGVGLMCCLLHVIIFSVLVMCILYDLLWWLWSSLSTTVPWVHGPPSSHWTTVVHSMGIDIKIFEVSLPWPFFPCLCIKVLWCLSSLSILISSLSITGIVPLTRQFNSSVTGLRKLSSSGVVLICSIAMCISPPQSEHFL